MVDLGDRRTAIAVVYSRTCDHKYAHEVDDMFEFLVKSVEELRTTHNVLIVGDFNARLGGLVGDTGQNANGPAETR